MFQCLCPLVPNFRSTTLWLRTAAGAAVGPPAGGEGPEGLQPHSGRGGGAVRDAGRPPSYGPLRMASVPDAAAFLFYALLPSVALISGWYKLFI